MPTPHQSFPTLQGYVEMLYLDAAIPFDIILLQSTLKTTGLSSETLMRPHGVVRDELPYQAVVNAQSRLHDKRPMLVVEDSESPPYGTQYEGAVVGNSARTC